ncbi:lipopolysaccharide heptosyltransferase II [Massilia sp. TS11]|uniref:lipopolysaccharide heptosyltransferase II n=1 Tax=Massilia sp. TS11 TaxID=2908003 RepID=UPI001EDA3810|nr:lipopolysaccharide heptosyltransferase II [Massilia sp. TS11]MCG2583640.1 lipopolysaccharide heptosyltransferase II [Massilia sp. TS11]
MRRLLIISPNWIGDAVMAQPLLARLRAADPDCLIDVLAPPAVAPVWRAVAEVAEVLTTPFRHGPLQLRERWRYGKVLRARGYAAAYVLPNTLKYALLPWFAGIRQRVGYKGESRYGLINVMHHDAVPPRPMVPFYAALAEAPDAPLAASLPRPRLVVDPVAQAAAKAKAGLAPGQPYVCFAPGAEFGGAKRWPPEHFARLAAEIQGQVLLLGSPKDADTCAQIQGPNVRSLAGQTTLDQAIALIAGARAMVANDSGLLHVAAALNRPVLGLYGPTDPDHAPPLAEHALALSLRLDCAPCRQRECPLGHQNCMRALQPQAVWQALDPLLRLEPPPRP